MNYNEFLKHKYDYGSDSGFEPTFVPSFLFDFQEYLVRWAVKKGRAAIFSDCGTGKGQPVGSKILTPNGWIEIQNLSLDNEVISSSGAPAKVTGVYPKEKQDVFEFHFSDRSSLIVDRDHLHIVRTNNDRQRGKPWRVMSTNDLLNCGNLRYGKEGKSRNYDIPIVGDVLFNDTPLHIDPYVMGALLGDGCFAGNISISSADRDLIDRFSRFLPEGVTLRQKNKYDWNIMTGLTGSKRHPFRAEIHSLGLSDRKSHNKFIPDKYLFSNPYSRLELLRGLMDTDGYIEKSGCSHYYSVSKKLADGVVHLVRSLGGIPTINIKKTSLNGKRYRDCYVVTFSLATHNPFFIHRKAKKWNPNPRDNGRWIDRIEYKGTMKTICIAVDSPDQSYVTENFIVTHNTPMQLVWAQNVIEHTNKPVLILTPLAVSGQTLEEAKKFDIEARRAQANVNGRAIVEVTNYEKLHYFDAGTYGGIVCDESSILKNFRGTRKAQITEFMRTIPYRLLCTATAAPNDWVELGTSSEALGYLGHTDMLTRFFTRRQTYALTDRGSRKEWRLKGHAEKGPFWQWVASWARAARRPADLGFDDDGFILPPLKERENIIEANRPRDGFLFDIPAVTFHESREVRRRTITERCEAAAEAALQNTVSMVWCNLNDEGDLLERLIPGSVQVAGRDTDGKKEEAARWFVHGEDERRILISKPSIFGFGLNFQHCAHMTYFPTYSYEQYYQATRLLWRFGQDREVVVDHFYTYGGKRMMEAIDEKAQAADEMFSKLVRFMNHELRVENVYQKKEMEVPEWMQ